MRLGSPKWLVFLDFNPLDPPNDILIFSIKEVFNFKARTELYTIKLYCSGGFFPLHTDTSLGDDYIGTLVAAPWSPFEGARYSHNTESLLRLSCNRANTALVPGISNNL